MNIWMNERINERNARKVKVRTKKREKESLSGEKKTMKDGKLRKWNLKDWIDK